MVEIRNPPDATPGGFCFFLDVCYCIRKTTNTMANFIKLAAWKKAREWQLNGRFLCIEVYPEGQTNERSEEHLKLMLLMLEKNHVTCHVKEIQKKEWLQIEVGIRPDFKIVPFLSQVLEWEIEEFLPTERKAA